MTAVSKERQIIMRTSYRAEGIGKLITVAGVTVVAFALMAKTVSAAQLQAEGWNQLAKEGDGTYAVNGGILTATYNQVELPGPNNFARYAGADMAGAALAGNFTASGIKQLALSVTTDGKKPGAGTKVFLMNAAGNRVWYRNLSAVESAGIACKNTFALNNPTFDPAGVTGWSVYDPTYAQLWPQAQWPSLWQEDMKNVAQLGVVLFKNGFAAQEFSVGQFVASDDRSTSGLTQAQWDEMAAKDTDNDGMSDLSEYLSVNNHDFFVQFLFRVNIIPVEDGTIVEWDAAQGKTYTVQRSPSVTKPEFTDISTPETAASATKMRYKDTNTTGQLFFYRVSEQ
jgi:hypothetical protein